MKEAPLFTRSYDLHTWLLDRLEGGETQQTTRLAVLHHSRRLLEAITLALQRFGLPIGNLTSQWWANFYLDGFDHFVKRQLKSAYLRYMDDLVFFGDSRAELRAWRTAARDWLGEHRRLRLNPRKGHIRSTRLPQAYLGYKISREGIDLGPKALRRFRKRLAKLDDLDPEVRQASVAAWWAAATF
jgi:hypothetical protein